MTQGQANDRFNRLAENLKLYRLPTGDGHTTEAKAEYFMLMHETGGRTYFKHRNTRQYVSQSLLGHGFAVHGDNYEPGYLALTDEELAAALN